MKRGAHPQSRFATTLRSSRGKFNRLRRSRRIPLPRASVDAGEFERNRSCRRGVGGSINGLMPVKFGSVTAAMDDIKREDVTLTGGGSVVSIHGIAWWTLEARWIAPVDRVGRFIWPAF